MTFDKVNRRVHLYGALVLLPWFLMYGVSSIPFSHPSPGRPEWSLRVDKEYSLPPIKPGDDLDAIGAALMREAGMTGRYGAHLNPAGNLEVYRPRFLGPSRITYYPEKQRLVAEDQKFRLNNFLTGMHARGGFEKAGFLDVTWAVLVDIASLAIIVWIASGLYMWWNLRQLRFWGWLALGAGLASFAIFLVAL
jgi:hypothetical protein